MNKNNIYDNLVNSDRVDISASTLSESLDRNKEIEVNKYSESSPNKSSKSEDSEDSADSSDSSDSSESSDEIDIDLYIRDTSGKMQIHPIKNILSKKHRLICFSSINGKECKYGTDCIYSHSLEDQHIDIDKLFAYQIVLDKKLMEYYSISNSNMINIYKKIMILTNYCESANYKKCTGGYNCKYGTHNQCLKVCKNDFLMGDCRNKIIKIDIDNAIYDKIINIDPSDEYFGCINGHHIANRGFVPYYKFLHEKEQQSRNKFITKKCIDLDDVSRMINRAVITEYSSSDDEIFIILDDCNSDDENNSIK